MEFSCASIDRFNLLLLEHLSRRDYTFTIWAAADTASRRLALIIKRRMLWPLYQWGLANGMEWLAPLKNYIYRLVGQWRRG